MARQSFGLFARFAISLLFIHRYTLGCYAEPLPIVDSRGPLTTCQLPELQPLIQSLAKNFPKSAVNSFCSSVVGTKGLPRTTTTKTQRATVKATITDTYIETTTICVTSIRKREEPTSVPKRGADLNAVANRYKTAPRLLTQACQCLLPTITKTFVVKETNTVYDFEDTTVVLRTTATVTKTLPTFIAQIRDSNAPVDSYYLQSGATDDENGNFVFNVLTSIKSKSLATIFSLTCEGFLLQTNTSALGSKRLLSDTIFTSGQSPVYFDEASLVDYSENGHNYPPLICRIDEQNPARQLLRCRAVTPQRNQWQYCASYEEFFATGVLLTDTVGPECTLFDAVIERK